MNKKALSPVVASIILITATVVASIAVAAWMGALAFTFIDTGDKVSFSVPIPHRYNATHVLYFIQEDSANYHRFSKKSTIFVPLPYNVTGEVPEKTKLIVQVTYFKEVSPSMYENVGNSKFTVIVFGEEV